MSSVPAGPPEFDFWEFVCCAKCRLPFAGATVPFWLTECGHVICNNHLNSDQSCAQCGSPGIQLIPLQHDMEAPMSEWFRSVPYILDSAAYAVKFQQESMASQIRNLQARHQQQRSYIEKLKHENAQLKQTNEMLTRMHHNSPEGYEPSPFLNVNGKRQMISQPQTSSSPRSVTTPIGPDRLTLPPGQQPPQLSSNQAIAPDENVPPRAHSSHPQRPGSSRFAQQYSYVPAQESQMWPPQLTHAQAAPQQSRRPLYQDHRSENASQSMMPPPPPPAKFKPSPTAHNSKASQPFLVPSQSSRDVMNPSGPPATALLSSSSRRPIGLQPNTNRFLPPNERFPPPTPVSVPASKRFVPPASSRGVPRTQASGYASSSTRAPSSRTQPGLPGGGSGQRMPFVPHGS